MALMEERAAMYGDRTRVLAVLHASVDDRPDPPCVHDPRPDDYDPDAPVYDDMTAALPGLNIAPIGVVGG